MKAAVARLGTVLALLMVAVPFVAGAQPAGKVYQIGILGDKASDANETRLWQTFRAGLQERGWKEGVTVRFEYRWMIDWILAGEPGAMIALGPDAGQTAAQSVVGQRDAAS